MTHNDVFVCTGVRPLAKAKKLKLARWTSYAPSLFEVHIYS